MSRVHVDRTRCDGHVARAEVLPELLGTDERGCPSSRTGESDPDLPPVLAAYAERALGSATCS